jgi:DNA-directed RNA polymerase subunit L
VEFVGAGETHPLEDRVILHIQTVSSDYPAADVLTEGFRVINQLYAGIEHTFSQSYKKFSK